MSGFSGINQFGSLTVNGQKLRFEDFDKDKNGEISKDEYNALLKEVQLDTVELSVVDKNGDETISEDEFSLWEQKIQMQDEVNNLSGTISKDFTGKTQYLTTITTALKDYIDDFANNYKGEDISKMAEDFKAALPTKYAELKASVLENDPDTAKSNVLDEIYTELTQPAARSGETAEPLPAATAKRIAKELEAEANKFVKAYTGNNLAADLKAHLEEYMGKSDAEKLQGAAEQFKANANSLGAMIDNGADLKQLKEYATEFLTAALDSGVTIRLGGITIKTTNAITTALSKFTDGDELKAAIEDVIANLNSVTLKDSIIAEEKQKAEEAAEKAFTDIKGSEYAVNANLIDYSGIPGYFKNTQIHERGKGWSGSRDKAYAKGRELLNNESLKNQMKAQIQTMLESKGIPFDKIAAVFENVYNQSISDTLNADGMITGRGARGLSSKGHAYLNTKDCIDAFITTFNTNIAKAVDEMNASNTDFDLQDLDYTQMGNNEEGQPVDQNLVNAYNKNKSITTDQKTALQDTVNIINRMKPQLLAKAKAMCDANGVAFDNEIFTKLFNNASAAARATIKLSMGLENFKPIMNGTMNPRTIMDTLTNNFKTSFTAWVETEKTKSK